MLLTTERLVLREFVPADWTAVLAYQREPEYLRFYQWTSRSADDVRNFVQRFVDWQHEQPRIRFQFAITLKATGALIGNCGIRRASAGAAQADIGYELAPAHWGNGYATEAARAVLAFGFRELQLHRVWASCIAENQASSRVLEKLGMRCEGRFRESVWIKGRWWDSLLYAILADEWSHA